MAEKISDVSKNFHAEHRGNCAMSVAYGYARATGKSEARCAELHQVQRNPPEQDYPLQPLCGTRRRGA